MSESIFIPARNPMVLDHKAMTITIGSWISKEPDLFRRPEWDFDFKATICGYPETPRKVRTWNKFYAEMLGCKFNWRFFGANYALWISSKMSQRVGHMLSYEGKNWNRYNTDLVRMAHVVLPYINEAEGDGLLNLIPIIIAHGASPQEIRATIGRGAWRRVANNSVARNKMIMNAMLRCLPERRAQAFVRLLEIPSGVLRAVNGASDDEVIAARITPKRRIAEFQQTLHMVSDTRDMLLPDEFNPQWSYARMRHEHEAATKAVMQRQYSPKKFVEAWSFAEGGYSATLLTSQADIATEGSLQHHCVANYARRAVMREYAIFRIEGKERATAGIVNGRVDQVYAACNALASEACTAFAHTLAKKYAAAMSKTKVAA